MNFALQESPPNVFFSFSAAWTEPEVNLRCFSVHETAAPAAYAMPDPPAPEKEIETF